MFQGKVGEGHGTGVDQVSGLPRLAVCTRAQGRAACMIYFHSDVVAALGPTPSVGCAGEQVHDAFVPSARRNLQRVQAVIASHPACGNTTI